LNIVGFDSAFTLTLIRLQKYPSLLTAVVFFSGLT